MQGPPLNAKAKQERQERQQGRRTALLSRRPPSAAGNRMTKKEVPAISGIRWWKWSKTDEAGRRPQSHGQGGSICKSRRTREASPARRQLSKIRKKETGESKAAAGAPEPRCGACSQPAGAWPDLSRKPVRAGEASVRAWAAPRLRQGLWRVLSRRGPLTSEAERPQPARQRWEQQSGSGEGLRVENGID